MCKQINIRYSCGHIHPDPLEGCSAAFDQDCLGLIIQEYPASDQDGLRKPSDGNLLCSTCSRKSVGEDFQENAMMWDTKLGRTEADRKEQLERSRAASRKSRGKEEDEKTKAGKKMKGKGPEKVREEHWRQKLMKRHWP